VRTIFPEHRFLNGRKHEPVAGHANTLAITNDIPEEVKRRPSCLKAESSPRC
jgi:hypothetical protein